jgi:diaminopimelate decarboxylase
LHQINVETEHELMRLAKIAQAKGKTINVALRVNPAIGAGGHTKIMTGDEDSKFGIDIQNAEQLYQKACALPGLNLAGLAVHIGSQILELDPLREAFTRVRHLAEKLRARNLPLTRLDLGGGLGVFYDAAEGGDTGAARVRLYAAMVMEVMSGFDVELSFEPGRLIVANSGVLMTKVITLNPRPHKNFLIVDAGMNDLLRPALYGARHEIWPVAEPEKNTLAQAYEVAGPVCESSDSFGKDFLLPQQKPGDLLCLMSAGAYGASMASTYNQRPHIAEVMVSGAQWAIVRERHSYEQMIRFDALPPWLKD